MSQVRVLSPLLQATAWVSRTDDCASNRACRRRRGPARGRRRRPRPPPQATRRVRGAEGCLVLRARPPLGLQRVRRGRVRSALGAEGERVPGHLLRTRCHGARAVGGRPPAPPRLSLQTTAVPREKGYPARGCAPRPAARGRLFCRRLVVNGRVVGEAALPGRAHLSPQDAPAGLARAWTAASATPSPPCPARAHGG